ncbi:Phosphoglucosamine mutase [compost metagenome]
MRDGGYNLGGEQSGHVIFSDFATTGDGVLTGLQLAAQVALTGRSLKDLSSAMTKLPQLMINVKDVDKARAATDEGVAEAVAAAELELGETGRVLLRPSGTEALVRVMVEAADMETAERICKGLAAVVKERLGAPSELAV